MQTEILASQSALELGFKVGLSELQSQIATLFSQVLPQTQPPQPHLCPMPAAWPAGYCYGKRLTVFFVTLFRVMEA